MKAKLLCWLFGHPSWTTKWCRVGMQPVTYRSFCDRCSKVLRKGVP